MSARKSEFPTLHEILQAQSEQNRRRTQIESKLSGKHIAPIQLREGVHLLTPGQLLGIRVPVQRVSDGSIRGYQQHLRPQQVRDFAKFLNTFEDDSYLRVVPIAEASITDDLVYMTDGQHRSAGGIVADRAIKVLLTKRTLAEARKLFAMQGVSRKPNRNVIIFNGDAPLDEYIQDAVTCDDHPWSNLITSSTYGPTDTRLSATTTRMMLNRYIGQPFDRVAADELAVLISAFGTKKTNPPAFRAKPLQATTSVARAVFRDRDPRPTHKARWATRMPRFNFTVVEYMPVSEISYRLIQHWNKALSDDDRAAL